VFCVDAKMRLATAARSLDAGIPRRLREVDDRGPRPRVAGSP
jgi:hypothetical protein